MFWKWKRRSDGPIDDAPLFEAPRERRNAYRVEPDPDAPVTMHIDGQTFLADNVSAGGAALRAASLPEKGLVQAILHVPDGEPDAPLQLEILRAGKHGLRHCRFVQLDDTLQDRLHRYVFEREKELIRKQRA